MPEDNNLRDEVKYANLGGIKIRIPSSLESILGHIAESHSEDLDSLGRSLMTHMERDLQGTRLGDGISTVLAIVGLAEDHMREGDLPDVKQARSDLYEMAFGLLRGLASESLER